MGKGVKVNDVIVIDGIPYRFDESAATAANELLKCLAKGVDLGQVVDIRLHLFFADRRGHFVPFSEILTVLSGDPNEVAA